MMLNLKYNSIIFLVLMLNTSLILANTVTKAVLAGENHNEQEAAKIWTQLANKGNTVAMYNLAGHYSSGKGIDQDKKLSSEWMQSAARSGLVQAYLKLNHAAVSTASGSTLTFETGPLHWLEKQEPAKYTIQLASSLNKTFIEKIYSKNKLKGKGGYYHFVSSGKDRYALVYGAYKTVAAAKVAIAKLPAGLRKSPPWVRKIKSLHKISK